MTEHLPFLHFVDDDGRTVRLGGDYFSRDAILLNEGTYANPDAELESPASIERVHNTADVVSALGAAGLRVEFLHEHDWIWYQLIPCLTREDDGRWRFPEGQPRIPLLYSLRPEGQVGSGQSPGRSTPEGGGPSPRGRSTRRQPRRRPGRNKQSGRRHGPGTPAS